jgi:hypothetical protein
VALGLALGAEIYLASFQTLSSEAAQAIAQQGRQGVQAQAQALCAPGSFKVGGLDEVLLNFKVAHFFVEQPLYNELLMYWFIGVLGEDELEEEDILCIAWQKSFLVCVLRLAFSRVEQAGGAPLSQFDKLGGSAQVAD